MVSHTPASLRTLASFPSGEPSVDDWIDGVMSRLTDGDREAFFTAYTLAGRRTTRGNLSATPSAEAPTSALEGVDVSRWSREDASRAALLLEASARLSPHDFVTLTTECYERGDSREQQSWLKSLPLLPDAERFLSVAIDACRTNILPQFEAIACENPYPERYFPELHFNQLTLKSMFMGVALARIVGLERRRNRELSRMALDYAAERRAAGRPIPSDLDRALTADARAEEFQG